MLEFIHFNRNSVRSRKTAVNLALSHRLSVSVYGVVLSSLFLQLSGVVLGMYSKLIALQQTALLQYSVFDTCLEGPSPSERTEPELLWVQTSETRLS